MQVNSLVALLSCALASQAAFASQHAHEAHVHGEVTFHVAQDGQQLLIEIEAPGADVVGFEYAPKNDAERDALQKAQTTLADGASLLLFPAAAKCQLLESEVANNADSHAEHDQHAHDEHKHHDDHDKHAHDEHKHHDDHDKHAHDEHKHHDDHDQHAHDEHKHHDEHDHHETSADSHNTFHAHYLFECGNIAALDTIDVQWFKQFPATQRVETHLFLDNWQGSQTLTSEQATLTFRQ